MHKLLHTLLLLFTQQPGLDHLGGRMEQLLNKTQEMSGSWVEPRRDH